MNGVSCTLYLMKWEKQDSETELGNLIPYFAILCVEARRSSPRHRFHRGSKTVLGLPAVPSVFVLV